ncbi:hypothetical protein AB0H23_32380 [Streptomyces albogriseolus]|uniref:hypothetical protein n=1 Tax=Streptomyces albogriseolus TaxID=1887 RepID=UPI00345FE9C3
MVPTAAPSRTRLAGLCRRVVGVPEWEIRSKQLERLAAAPVPERRATLARYDDAVVVDLLVLSYLRHGTPYWLWCDTLAGFAEDILGAITWAQLHRRLDAA